MPAPEPAARSSVTLSAGCGQVAPAPPTSVRVGGLERPVITAVPPRYEASTPHMLVVAFHGRTNANNQARAYFGLEAALPGAIIVYPSGLRQGESFTWSDSADPPDALRDYALFDEVVRVMSAGYCLDTRRIFVVGHSLGAWFANSLACARSGVVRGVASLAGGVSAGACPQGVAAMIAHNPRDELVPVAQGEAARDLFLSTNRAAAQGVTITSAPLRDLRCSWYSETTNPVVWCPHNINHRYDGSYYPHTWPGVWAEAVGYFFRVLD